MGGDFGYILIAWLLIVLLIIGLDEDREVRAADPAIALACGPLPEDLMPSDPDGSYGRLLERYEPLLCGEDILFKRRDDYGR